VPLAQHLGFRSYGWGMHGIPHLPTSGRYGAPGAIHDQ
jgi:hypothetical protein